jgi:hypothetical protein
MLTGQAPVDVPSSDVAIPIPGTAGTKGSWVNIVTLARDANWMAFTVWGPSVASGASSLIDFGVAAGADTQIVVPNLFYSLRGSQGGRGMPVILPVYFPAGSVVRARLQNSQTAGTSVSFRGGFHWIDGLPACTRWATLGADTTNSRGTALSTTTVTSLGTLPFATRWAWLSLGPAMNQTLSHAGHPLRLYIDNTLVEELFVLFRPETGEAAESMGRLLPLIAPAGATLAVQSVFTTNTIYVTVTVGG